MKLTFAWKYRICLYKEYFDMGFNLLSYAKYLIILLGMYSIVKDVNIWLTLAFAFSYGVLCFLLGWWWYKSDFKLAQQEVQNRYNLFVGEMRKKFVKPNK